VLCLPAQALGRRVIRQFWTMTGTRVPACASNYKERSPLRNFNRRGHPTTRVVPDLIPDRLRSRFVT